MNADRERKYMYSVCSACFIILVFCLVNSFGDIIDINFPDAQFIEPNEIFFAFTGFIMMRLIIIPPILVLAWNHILANTFQVSKIKYSQALVLEAVWMLFALVY